MLTPLPGSEDHNTLHEQGVWMEPDLNAYDLETATVAHPRMSREEWQSAHADAWNWYYSDEHVERLLKRNAALGVKTLRVWRGLVQIYGAANYEGVHPQQCGYFRRKSRAERRPELPREPMLAFYVGHVSSTIVKYARFGLYALKAWRIRNPVEKDPASKPTLTSRSRPSSTRKMRALEMFDLNEYSRAAVEKARRQAHDRKFREDVTAP